MKWPRVSSRNGYGLSWIYVAMAGSVAVSVILPLIYLVIRAFQADFSQLREFVFRQRNVMLLEKTIWLTIAVLITSSLIAFPLAWLTTRTKIYGRRFFTLVGVLPLAIPSYLFAYAYISLGGQMGLLAKLFGLSVDRLHGFWGALVALTFSNFPYMFLNLWAALQGIDPAQEESARALGASSGEVFFRITLPQLKPAFGAGALLICLHVLGDFGVVSMMRYETFSFSIYTLYRSGYLTYSAWIALVLVILAVIVLYMEARILRGIRFDRVGKGARRQLPLVRLGGWSVFAYCFLVMVIIFGFLVPLSTIFYWAMQPRSTVIEFSKALVNALSISVATAFFATLFAIPVAYIGVRYTGKLAKIIERISYVGYAIPALAFGLALIFLFRGSFFYQTTALLIYALSIHFLAEAIGPIRSTLYQTPPQLEESARALGCGTMGAFFRVTLPLLANSIIASASFVFLSVMKELPLTYLLAPIGFRTLAVNAFDNIEEAMFAEASPYAMAILLFSTLFVGVLLYYERRTR